MMQQTLATLANSLKGFADSEEEYSCKRLNLLRDSVKEIHTFKTIAQYLFASSPYVAFTMYQYITTNEDKKTKKVEKELEGDCEKENFYQFANSTEAFQDILGKIKLFCSFLSRQENYYQTLEIPENSFSEVFSKEITVGELALALFDTQKISSPSEQEFIGQSMTFVRKWRKRSDSLMASFDNLLNVVKTERQQSETKSVEYNLCVSPKKAMRLDSETAASNENRRKSFIYVEENSYGAKAMCLSLDSDFKPIKLDFNPPSHLDSLKSSKSSQRMSDSKYHRSRTQSTTEINSVLASKQSILPTLTEKDEGTENSFVSSSGQAQTTSKKGKYSADSIRKFNKIDTEIKEFKCDAKFGKEKPCMKCNIY